MLGTLLGVFILFVGLYLILGGKPENLMTGIGKFVGRIIEGILRFVGGLLGDLVRWLGRQVGQAIRTVARDIWREIVRAWRNHGRP